MLMGIGAAYSVSEQRRAGDTRDGAKRGGTGPRHAHRDDRETAGRGNVDPPRVVELGVGAESVAEGSVAAAGDRGGLPGGEVDTSDAAVSPVLR